MKKRRAYKILEVMGKIFSIFYRIHRQSSSRPTEVKLKMGKPVTTQCGNQLKATHLLLAGNDTVPISV